MQTINRFDKDYAFLSNFYPAEVTFCGYTFPTVENAFQAAKCRNLEDMEQFIHMTPGQAKRAGRRVKLVDGWDAKRIDIMTELVTQKFTKYPELREKLLATENAQLIEGNTWHDNFWGVCQCYRCRSGKNNLGMILMKVRNNLKA